MTKDKDGRSFTDFIPYHRPDKLAATNQIEAHPDAVAAVICQAVAELNRLAGRNRFQWRTGDEIIFREGEHSSQLMSAEKIRKGIRGSGALRNIIISLWNSTGDQSTDIGAFPIATAASVINKPGVGIFHITLAEAQAQILAVAQDYDPTLVTTIRNRLNSSGRQGEAVAATERTIAELRGAINELIAKMFANAGKVSPLLRECKIEGSMAWFPRVDRAETTQSAAVNQYIICVNRGEGHNRAPDFGVFNIHSLSQLQDTLATFYAAADSVLLTNRQENTVPKLMTLHNFLQELLREAQVI